MSKPQVFFVTGCSSGFGFEFVKTILQNNQKVVATSRNAEKLPKWDQERDDNLLKVSMDVTKLDSIEKGFKAAVDKFGQIDVVCNNAGFGVAGAFETISDKQARMQMDINFFGVVNVTRVAMRIMRESGRGGRIQQITSIGGLNGVPAFSFYCASKFAIEGFTEAVSRELKPEWNIALTCIEPGGFRTEFSGDSINFGELENEAYDHVAAREDAKQRNKSQDGDPAKAGEAFYELAVMKDPPLHVVLGSDAYNTISGKLDKYVKEIKKYEALSKSTDIEEK